MKALVLTSNNLRHQFFAHVISQHFNFIGIISETKSNYFTKVKEESFIIQKHFINLEKTEKKFFSKVQFPAVEILALEATNINEDKIVRWAVKKKPDLIFLFGTGILHDCWLTLLKDKMINLHLGLSPWYRGLATLFWPFVNNEIEKVGTTIYLVNQKVDAGNILE